jgi:hypothetical protein
MSAARLKAEEKTVGIMERLRRGSRNWARTIAVVEPPPRLQNVGMANAKPNQEDATDSNVKKDTFKIRLAHDESRTREARFLVEKRYRDVGYQVSTQSDHKTCPERITLATYKGDEVIGTITVGFDTGAGLLVDELYKPEIDSLRQQGLRVCEFTKLAIDHKGASKRMIAGLFHVAYIYAVKIWDYTDIVIEVNPSHVAFYQRMLGFQPLGVERICPRVGAPALLLRLDAAGYATNMIEKFGGHPELSKQERTLYPYFMPTFEEQAILARIARG